MKVPTTLATLGCLLPALFGASCGGSGSASSTVTFAITDAASDEIASFFVEVESFRLEKPGGAVVSILSEPVTIDLASLTDLSQVMNVKTVPVGIYSGASITFDFANAQCVLVDNATPAALFDGDGNALSGKMTMPISFGATPFEALTSKHQLLQLDFDLDQSLMVDSLANTVAVEPVLLLQPDPTGPKTLIAVGTLSGVNESLGTIQAELKTLGGQPIGDVEFKSTILTVYQVDGESSIGANGLSALAAKSAGTWLEIWGLPDPNSPRILSIYVGAGAGTYNGGSDIVTGHVIARTAGPDPTLTVRGHSNSADHTSFQFNTDFTVTTSSANTKILKDTTLNTVDLDDVNVGQHVRMFGALTGADLDMTETDGVLRMRPTHVFGFANSAPLSGNLSLSVTRIGLVPEPLFQWADSGLNAPDPDAFQMDVAGLGVGLSIDTDTAVLGRGFFTPVDEAGEDFGASTLVNLDAAPSLLFVRDVQGLGQTLVVTAILTSIQVDVTGSAGLGEAAVIDKAFVGTQDLPTSPTPEVRPTTNGFGLYFLKDKAANTNQLFLTFTAFSDAIAMRVALGSNVGQLSAVGTYDADANTVESGLASACLE